MSTNKQTNKHPTDRPITLPLLRASRARGNYYLVHLHKRLSLFKVRVNINVQDAQQSFLKFYFAFVLLDFVLRCTSKSMFELRMRILITSHVPKVSRKWKRSSLWLKWLDVCFKVWECNKWHVTSQVNIIFKAS